MQNACFAARGWRRVGERFAGGLALIIHSKDKYEYIYRITILKSNIRRKESESSVKCAKLGMWELSLRGEVQAATPPPPSIRHESN